MKPWRVLAALLLGAFACDAAAADRTAFDFYVLSLSWSPSYCEAGGGTAGAQQCRSAKPHGFIVHGFWPQRERGYPADCAAGERGVAREDMRGLYDIMPSAALIRHEWRKHGTCSGLAQADYFALLRKARERVSVPAQFRRLSARRSVDPRAVERAFGASNPGLDGAAMAVTCDGALLDEVRICMTKSLDFRACPEVDRRACRRAQVAMPPNGAD